MGVGKDPGAERDTPELASPPCLLHEIDPAWSQLERGASCEFCRIASGEHPARVVFEDDAIVAFADAMPLREGHVQIIPRAHYVCFDDMPADLAARMLHLGQRLAKAQKRLYGVARVGFVFSGNDVAHAHAHVIPLHHRTDVTSRRYIAEKELTFAGRPAASDAEMARVAAALTEALAAT
jgi:histidine triad (HIT) family protein